jgi:hypothetical protein
MKKTFISIILTGLFLAALSSCAPHKTCATYAQNTKTQKINKASELNPISTEVSAKK